MQGGEVLLDQDWNDGNEGGEPEVAQGEADSEVDVRADDAQEGWTSTIGEGAEGPPGEMAEAIPINIPYPRPDKLTEADDSISTEGAEGPPGELVEAIPINIPHPRPDKPTESEGSIITEGAEGPPGELVEAIPINIPHPRPEKPTEADEVISTEGAEGPPGDLAEAIPINIPHPRPDSEAGGEASITTEGTAGPSGEMVEAIPINIPHPRPNSIDGESKDDSRGDEMLREEVVAELKRIEANLPESAKVKIKQAETVFKEHLTGSTGSDEIMQLATKTVHAQFGDISESERNEVMAVILSHTLEEMENITSDIENVLREGVETQDEEPAEHRAPLGTFSVKGRGEETSDESTNNQSSGAAAAAEKWSLAAMKEDFLKQIWADKNSKAEDMMSAQHQHIQRMKDMIEEMNRIYSQTVDALNNILR
jgi:hypothetical protein